MGKGQKNNEKKKKSKRIEQERAEEEQREEGARLCRKAVSAEFNIVTFIIGTTVLARLSSFSILLLPLSLYPSLGSVFFFRFYDDCVCTFLTRMILQTLPRCAANASSNKFARSTRARELSLYFPHPSRETDTLPRRTIQCFEKKAQNDILALPRDSLFASYRN